MAFLRTTLGAIVGAVIAIVVFRLIPFTPDLTDWGGRAYPRTYLFPLLVTAIVSYISAWAGSKFSPETGRLCGMFSMLITAVVEVGWNFSGGILTVLFHHPAYPVFSDHALLGLAVMLVAGHLAGLRVERAAAGRAEKDRIASDAAQIPFP